MKKVNEVEKTYEKLEQESTKLSKSDFCEYNISFSFITSTSRNLNLLNLMPGTRAAKKATIIALFLCGLNQFCGAFSLSNYANQIFKESGSTLSEDMSSVIIAIFQLSANIITMMVVEIAGRRLLITISSFGTAVGLISMGLYDMYKMQLDNYKWIPIASFSTVIFMASIGMLPLTYVLLGEILPKKVTKISNTRLSCGQMF